MQPYHRFSQSNWQDPISVTDKVQAIETLENGQLLLFPRLAFELQAAEKQFLNPSLLAPKSKNISFQSRTQQLAGAVVTADLAGLQNMLHRFAADSQSLVEKVLPHYVGQLTLGRTSFRPAAVSDRKTSYRKDDRLLHVDAFPATPMQGLRILRVFSNVNPQDVPRIWNIGESFSAVAKTFIPKIRPPFPGKHALLKTLKLTKTKRRLYDHYMLNIHDRMKGDALYQQTAQQSRIELPAQSTWIVQTDQVSHAALAGQFMLEQTFYLPVTAMLHPERSPLRILESMLKRDLLA